MLIQLLFKTLIAENQQSRQKKMLGRIQQAEQLAKEAQFEKALEEMIQYEKILHGMDEPRFSCRLIQSELLLLMGQVKEGLELATQILQENRQLDNHLHQPDTLLSLAQINSQLGNYDEGLEMIVQSEQLLKTLPTQDHSSAIRLMSKLPTDISVWWISAFFTSLFWMNGMI